MALTWTDCLCDFVSGLPGMNEQSVLDEVREREEAVIGEDPEITVCWERIDRDSRRGGGGGRLVDGKYVYYPGLKYMSTGPMYTLVKCRLYRRRPFHLHMQTKKPLFGRQWRWKIRTDLPDTVVEALKSALLAAEPDRPDFYTLRLLPSSDGYDTLIVETNKIWGSVAGIRGQHNYYPVAQDGRELGDRQTVVLMFDRMIELLRKACQVLA